MKRASSDIVIIGAGVIGLTSAWYLSKAGANVLVLDQSEPGRESSWAGAGILSPCAETSKAITGKDRLLTLSREHFETLSKELCEQTGIDNGYRHCGGVEVFTEGLQSIESKFANECTDLGITFEPISSQQISKIESGLATNLGSMYYFPTMAQVRNPRHLKALQMGCIQNGVELLSGCTVHGWERTNARITGAQTTTGTISADKFLITTGAWTDVVCQSLNITTGIHPIRGQIALLRSARPCLTRIIQSGKRYLVPRPEGRVLVGSTEEEAGFVKRTTSQGIEELLRFAQEMCPSLADAELEKCWAGIRPGRSHPLMGPVPDFENLFLAAGHYRSGIQLSPGTGLLMKELLLGEALSLPLDDFTIPSAN